MGQSAVAKGNPFATTSIFGGFPFQDMKLPMNRKTIREVGVGIGCLGLVLCLLALAPGLLLGGLLIAGSERTIYERATSPDGWHDARVQFDDGGAMSSFSRLVFVTHHWNHSDEPLLSCRAFRGEGEAPVHLRWLDDSTLLIQHGFSKGDVEAVADHCGPVRIVVRELKPNEVGK